jgi:hypothetical protein
VRNGHSGAVRTAFAAALATLLLAGCPAGGTAREGTTDADRQRAAALRADPLLAGAPVTAGDAYTGSFPGWHRTAGQRHVSVAAGTAVAASVAALLARARSGGWRVFATRCDPTGTWSAHAYRPESGWTADLRITARGADRDPTREAGEVTLTLLAPYHLDPPSLVGDPPPPALARTCLDAPARAGADGTDRPVDAEHRD